MEPSEFSLRENGQSSSTQPARPPLKCLLGHIWLHFPNSKCANKAAKGLWEICEVSLSEPSLYIWSDNEVIPQEEGDLKVHRGRMGKFHNWQIEQANTGPSGSVQNVLGTHFRGVAHGWGLLPQMRQLKALFEGGKFPGKNVFTDLAFRKYKLQSSLYFVETNWLVS